MPQRDEKGRFVRADGKATLHRQVSDVLERLPSADGADLYFINRPRPSHYDDADPARLHRQSVPDPHGPRISLGILVCTVLAIALSVAIIAWLLGVRL